MSLLERRGNPIESDDPPKKRSWSGIYRRAGLDFVWKGSSRFHLCAMPPMLRGGQFAAVSNEDNRSLMY